jgi:hypothetical protein
MKTIALACIKYLNANRKSIEFEELIKYQNAIDYLKAAK